jgi:hypothetical protein
MPAARESLRNFFRDPIDKMMAGRKIMPEGLLAFAPSACTKEAFMFTFRLGQIVRLAACAAVAGTVVLAVPMVARADGPTPQEIARYKATHDTDPHLPLSADDQALLAQKDEKARAHYSAITGSIGAAAGFANYIGGTQQGQLNWYYCGPASVSEAVGIQPGISLSQTTAAYLLKTNTDGTAWSGVYANVPAKYRTGYPVRDVMNYKLGHFWYYPIGVPYPPSSGDISSYKSRMTFDIDYDYPVIGDAWEVYNGPHLAGHPNLQQDILHWFTINGYASYGSLTDYMDSATTVWSTVYAYNYNFNSATLVSILGGRGYVW